MCKHVCFSFIKFLTNSTALELPGAQDQYPLSVFKQNLSSLQLVNKKMKISYASLGFLLLKINFRTSSILSQCPSNSHFLEVVCRACRNCIVEPVESVKPVVPIEHAKHVEPVESVESVEPVELVELVEHVEPVETVEQQNLQSLQNLQIAVNINSKYEFLMQSSVVILSCRTYKLFRLPASTSLPFSIPQK